jgi:hypothetical protein
MRSINETSRNEDVLVSGVITPTFLPSARDEGEWLASRPDRCTPDERGHDTDRIGVWMGTRAGLETAKKKKSLAPAGN